MVRQQYWIVRIQKTVRRGIRRRGEQKEANKDTEYKILLKIKNSFQVYNDMTLKAPVTYNDDSDIEYVYGPFDNTNDVIKKFNLITAKPTSEKITRGVQLARDVQKVKENNASVELNFKLIQDLSQAIVDTTDDERTEAQEIIDIDKILCCARGWRDSCKPTLHIMYIFFAAVIAAAGLWTDSGPTVVASMLVSTMMEPINGMRFVVSRANMVPQRQRFFYHLLTLLGDMAICIGVGLAAGGMSAVAHEDTWKSQNGTFAYTQLEYLAGTNVPDTRRQEDRIILPGQMSSRTSSMGLVVAVVVAGVSALALFYATRSDNKSALVGIGISASLLPPMVNAGMLWALSWSDKENINGDSLADMGWISFALTWINVGMIVVLWGLLSFLTPKFVPLLPCKKRKIPLASAKRVEIPTVPSTEFGETARLIF